MIRINLLPKEERKRKVKQVDWVRMSAIFAVSLTVLVLIVTVYSSRVVSIYRNQLDSFASQVQVVYKLQSEQRDLNRTKETLTEKKDFLASITFMDKNNASMDLYIGILNQIPDSVWLEELYFATDRTLTFTGYSLTSEAVTTLLDDIEANENVRTVELARLERLGTPEFEIRAFRLRITLESK